MAALPGGWSGALARLPWDRGAGEEKDRRVPLLSVCVRHLEPAPEALLAPPARPFIREASGCQGGNKKQPLNI